MNSADYAQWNAQVLLGFWFLANYLRTAVNEERIIKQITDSLTEQYEQYRENSKKGHFGPRFRINVVDRRAEEVRIVMEHPNEPIEIGRVDLAVSSGTITILCEETA